MTSYPIKLKVEPVVKEWLTKQKAYQEPYKLSKSDPIGLFLFSVLKETRGSGKYLLRDLCTLTDEYQVLLPSDFAMRKLSHVNNAASCKFNNLVKHLFFSEFQTFMKRELQTEYSPKKAVRKFIDEYNLIDLINEARLIKHFQRHIGTARKNKPRK